MWLSSEQEWAVLQQDLEHSLSWAQMADSDGSLVKFHHQNYLEAFEMMQSSVLLLILHAISQEHSKGDKISASVGVYTDGQEMLL